MNRNRRALLATAGAAALAGLSPRPAAAALAVGAAAPDFSTDAALDGKVFRFTLSQALQQGPVVLYFFPKAFTSGCTLEAHAFAEATPQFEALGARVVGMSADGIETLREFSLAACRSRFAVAADAGARVMRQYDAALARRPEMADRITYLVGPGARILFAHAGADPEAHVQQALQALQAWRAAHPRAAPARS